MPEDDPIDYDALGLPGGEGDVEKRVMRKTEEVLDAQLEHIRKNKDGPIHIGFPDEPPTARNPTPKRKDAPE